MPIKLHNTALSEAILPHSILYTATEIFVAHKIFYLHCCPHTFCLWSIRPSEMRKASEKLQIRNTVHAILKFIYCKYLKDPSFVSLSTLTGSI